MAGCVCVSVTCLLFEHLGQHFSATLNGQKDKKQDKTSVTSLTCTNIRHPSQTTMDIDHKQQENSDEEFLATLSSQASTPAVQDAIAQFGQLSGRKLWHQLTVSLMAFLRMPQDTGHLQVSLWDGFIEKYRKRMDQLRVVEMATMVSQQYEGEFSVRQ
jgi:hypothetical protein